MSTRARIARVVYMTRQDGSRFAEGFTSEAVANERIALLSDPAYCTKWSLSRVVSSTIRHN